MKKSLKINVLLGIFIFIGISNSIFAQWDINISTLQEYSDNPFHSPFVTESYISSLNLSVDRAINTMGIGYYGNYTNFSESSERNYYWHQLKIWNTSNNIMYGLNIEQRFNGNDYNFYNYLNYSGYMKYKFNIEDVYIFGNSSLNVTDYSDLNDLDNLLGSVNITANKSFETKTTLIGGVDFKYKRYFNTEFSSLEMIDGNNISQIESNTAFTSQLNFFGKIAQSLTPTTGLAVQFTSRNIIGGTAKTIRQLDFAYGDESKYFDDPISYEGYTASLQLTQILPLEIILRGSYFYNNKEYPSQGAYVEANNFDNEITRIDAQQIINLGVQKKFYFGEQESTALTLLLNYQHINNSSNSFWYNYNSNKIKFGLNYNF
ncbi:MAG: hypothetical protein V3V16_14200 [Melioribacteraceae bacterium]